MTPYRKEYDASSKWPEAVDPWLQSPGTSRWPQQIGTRLALSKWSGCLNCNWWFFDTGLHIHHLSWDCGPGNLLANLHLALKHHWHIHEHTNVLDLWDVHGFMRFLKQWRLSVCLSWCLGPISDWRSSRNKTMALVTRLVRTFRRRPHYTTFWKEVCKIEPGCLEHREKRFEI